MWQSEVTEKLLTYFVRGSITVGLADLMFEWFWFDETSKFIVNSTYISKVAEFKPPPCDVSESSPAVVPLWKGQFLKWQNGNL